MSKEERDQEFWTLTDAFINFANEQCDKSKNAKVSSALLFATARFNAFLVASLSKDLADLEKDHDVAVQYFSQQYQQAFADNLKDYEKNYQEYVGKLKSE